jgi:hypothetical protein
MKLQQFICCALSFAVLMGCMAGTTHVSFNPVPAATSYAILVSTNADMSNASTNVTTASSLTISGLSVGTNYIAAQAMSDTATSDLTKPATAVVPAIGATTITLKP